jgi:TolB-like protein
VIARNSAAIYKAKLADVRRIGRKLGVGYLLQESLQQDGGRLSVTAHLIEATSGAHVGSQ